MPMRARIAPQMQAEIGSLRRPSLKGYRARHETADSSGDRAKHSQRLQRTMKSRAGVSEGRQVQPIVYEVLHSPNEHFPSISTGEERGHTHRGKDGPLPGIH